jgi:hypothetical protein
MLKNCGKIVFVVYFRSWNTCVTVTPVFLIKFYKITCADIYIIPLTLNPLLSTYPVLLSLTTNKQKLVQNLI